MKCDNSLKWVKNPAGFCNVFCSMSENKSYPLPPKKTFSIIVPLKNGSNFKALYESSKNILKNPNWESNFMLAF